ncbi:MAG: FAD-dependent oxidoreductase, partial [Pseudomonadota bacterium]
MKIAIVGAGVAGLAAACRLGREHDVTVYEARDRLGGHTHTVTVDEQGTERHIDTGFIVYNERNYPRFCALLAELGLATQPSDMSFGVHNAASGLAYSGAVPWGLFAQRRRVLSPAHWRFLAGIVAFGRAAKQALAQWPEARLAEYDL